MIRVVILLIVFYLLYLLVKEWKAAKRSSKAGVPAAGEDLVEDPLCHAYIPISHALRISVDGRVCYFCSRKCLEEYCGNKKP
jgi:YHS domain-containing protein